MKSFWDRVYKDFFERNNITTVDLIIENNFDIARKRPIAMEKSPDTISLGHIS